MGQYFNEQKVLKKLDIKDFRYLTKDKVIKMASMLDRMDPEVAKKALEQFPEFSKTTKEMLVDYKETLDKGFQSNNESIKACYTTYNALIISLQKELEKETLSFQERKYIIEQMKDIAEKVDKKDTENKRFIVGMAGLGIAALATVTFALASALGNNTQIEMDDTNKID